MCPLNRVFVGCQRDFFERITWHCFYVCWYEAGIIFPNHEGGPPKISPITQLSISIVLVIFLFLLEAF